MAMNSANWLGAPMPTKGSNTGALLFNITLGTLAVAVLVLVGWGLMSASRMLTNENFTATDRKNFNRMADDVSDLKGSVGQLQQERSNTSRQASSPAASRTYQYTYNYNAGTTTTITTNDPGVAYVVGVFMGQVMQAGMAYSQYAVPSPWQTTQYVQVPQYQVQGQLQLNYGTITWSWPGGYAQITYPTGYAVQWGI